MKWTNIIALVRNQVNFNSVLSIIIAVVLGAAVKKLDENNTILIEVRSTQLNVLNRVAALESRLNSQDLRINDVATKIQVLDAVIHKP